MDPVQYILHLVEQGLSREDALSHASARFGLSRAALVDAIDAKDAEAHALIRAIAEAGF